MIRTDSKKRAQGAKRSSFIQSRRTELAPRHGIRRQGSNETEVKAVTRIPGCRSLHLIPTSPQDPGLDFSISNEFPWPAGQDHGGKTLFRLGGPTEFNYSICRRLVDSCFPSPWDQQPWPHAPVAEAVNQAQKGERNKSVQNGSVGRIWIVVIMTRHMAR